MRLKVIDKHHITPDIVRLALALEDGREQLPPFELGAHIELRLAGLERRYSLTSSPQNLKHYEICVLRTPASRGGSVYIHDEVTIGDVLEVGGPHNAFELDEDAAHSVFIAGGIGITPFYTMIDALWKSERSCELHYAARHADRLALLEGFDDSMVRTYLNSNDRPALDINALMRHIRRDAHIYVCGPQSMIDAARAQAAELGWPREAIHLESFGAAPRAEDRSIRVHLSLTQTTVTVEPGTTILEALLAQGVWASYECERGECGSCYVSVAEGEADHRDVCLSPKLRSQGMCTCVSWARSPELTLEI